MKKPKIIWLIQYTFQFRKRTKWPWRTCWQDADAMLENIEGDTGENISEMVQESLYAIADCTDGIHV